MLEHSIHLLRLQSIAIVIQEIRPKGCLTRENRKHKWKNLYCSEEKSHFNIRCNTKGLVESGNRSLSTEE